MLQTDGILVVYASSGKALWSSGTDEVMGGLVANLSALVTAGNALIQSQQSALQLQTNALSQTYALVNNIASLLKSLMP